MDMMRKRGMDVFYILLADSLGLRKFPSMSVQWAFLFMLVLTELQLSILNHPYYL
jgi:hypothetical protein